MVWGTTLPSQPVILKPRPLQPNGGSILLVPLLPHKKVSAPLPAEIWTVIFSHAYYGEDNVDPTSNSSRHTGQSRRGLLLICKALTVRLNGSLFYALVDDDVLTLLLCWLASAQNIALPVFYSRVWIQSLWQLEKFTTRLHVADRQWDSLRRIPYSVPGRWVQDLNLSSLDCGRISLALDELLTKLFPLLPFMATLVLNTAVTLSGRALSALTHREGNEHLKSLKGIQAPATQPCNQICYPASVVDGDPLVQLVRKSVHLEEIEIYGPGFDSLEVDLAFQVADDSPSAELEREGTVPRMSNPLKLNSLRSLTMFSTHASPLMCSLLSSELPSLQRLAVTPYDDLPYPISLVSKFIQIHGSTLRSLHFYTPRDKWPKVSNPSPSDILFTCPNLTHLSLEFPLPGLKIPQGDAHPLQILSIPRPNQHSYETVSTLVSSLKNLRVVRTRDVRWLRRGIISQAMETGTQGEMREWKRRFASRGVTLLDADMNRDGDYL